MNTVACTIFRLVKVDNCANVLSNFKGLRGAGGTFFLLEQMQDDLKYLWGKDEPKGSVLGE